MPSTNPYSIVSDFEERIAEWAGSKYAVATDSCTSAIFLSLMYRKIIRGDIGHVMIPKYTYPSVPCSIVHCGGRVEFINDEWQGMYELYPTRVFDSALRFKKGMYDQSLKNLDALVCLSMHIKKALPIGRGGMILTDNENAYKWLRKARFDGRNPVPLQEDHFDMLGWNCYMTPEQASRGIQLFELIRNKDNKDLRVEEQGYPDLSQYKIYTQ